MNEEKNESTVYRIANWSYPDDLYIAPISKDAVYRILDALRDVYAQINTIKTYFLNKDFLYNHFKKNLPEKHNRTRYYNALYKNNNTPSKYMLQKAYAIRLAFTCYLKDFNLGIISDFLSEVYDTQLFSARRCNLYGIRKKDNKKVAIDNNHNIKDYTFRIIDFCFQIPDPKNYIEYIADDTQWEIIDGGKEIKFVKPDITWFPNYYSKKAKEIKTNNDIYLITRTAERLVFEMELLGSILSSEAWQQKMQITTLKRSDLAYLKKDSTAPKKDLIKQVETLRHSFLDETFNATVEKVASYISYMENDDYYDSLDKDISLQNKK